MSDLGLVISAFPGTGKSYLAGVVDGVSDSDSSGFSKDGFPANYIAAIKERRKQSRVVMVSSHAEVRAALSAQGIPYVVAYPDRVSVNEYRQRYMKRGSPEPFVEMMCAKWDSFIDSVSSDAGAVMHIRMPPGAYLADYFHRQRISSVPHE